MYSYTSGTSFMCTYVHVYVRTYVVHVYVLEYQRGISRALALQQGYIAEEIHAPDRAAQGTMVRGRGARAIFRTWV